MFNVFKRLCVSPRETDGWGGLSCMNKIKMCASSLSREKKLLVRMLMLVAYFASSV
jgi:hypothetical protein